MSRLPPTLAHLILILCITLVFTERCPNPSDIQDPWVAANFSMDAFLGQYYEIAYHDYTQPQFCGCQTAYKSMSSESNAPLHDNFTIQCNGHTYPNDLIFSLTDKKAVFNGSWAVLPGVVFPDTVVDVGHHVDSITNEIVYDWALEFQCVEVLGNIVFVGVNYYSRSDSQRDFAAMNASAYNHGIWPYIEAGFGLKIVDRSKCNYGETKLTAFLQ